LDEISGAISAAADDARADREYGTCLCFERKAVAMADELDCVRDNCNHRSRVSNDNTIIHNPETPFDARGEVNDFQAFAARLFNPSGTYSTEEGWWCGIRSLDARGCAQQDQQKSVMFHTNFLNSGPINYSQKYSAADGGFEEFNRRPCASPF
jgi:hypothetical protein